MRINTKKVTQISKQKFMAVVLTTNSMICIIKSSEAFKKLLI